MLHFIGVIGSDCLHAVVHVEDTAKAHMNLNKDIEGQQHFYIAVYKHTRTCARAHTTHTQSAEHCSSNSASFAELHWALGAPQKPPLLIMNMHSFEAFVSAALLLSYLLRNSPHPRLLNKYRRGTVALCISHSLHEPSRPGTRLVPGRIEPPCLGEGEP